MSFEREFMAALTLGIVWVNTGLIVAHAVGDLRRIRQLRRRLLGTVGRFDGGGEGAAAIYRLVQTGRSRGDGSIHFHDRRAESTLAGEARLDTPQGQFKVDAEQAGTLWVWPTEAEVRGAASCGSLAEYDALAGSALHARGAERVVEVRLTRGFVSGGRTDGGLLRGEPGSPLIFSPDDPRARLSALGVRIVLVSCALLVVLGALTALCFVGPAFGTVSRLAALGLFLYFLLVQPLGVWLSESVRWPHELKRGGTWVRARLPAADSYEVGSRVTSG